MKKIAYIPDMNLDVVVAQTPKQEDDLAALGWNETQIDGMSHKRMEIVLKKKIKPTRPNRRDGCDCEDDILARFDEGEDADPTKNMSPEDAKKWNFQKMIHRDEFTDKGDEKDGGLDEGFMMALDTMAEGCPDNLDPSECSEWESNTDKYEDKFKGDEKDSGLEPMAEGCPDNLDGPECSEWEANTDKYEDKFKGAAWDDMGNAHKWNKRQQQEVVEDLAKLSPQKLRWMEEAVTKQMNRATGDRLDFLMIQREILSRAESLQRGNKYKIKAGVPETWTALEAQLKTAKVSPRSRAGTRVVMKANPASRALYTNPPADGMEGTVTPVSIGRGKVTFMGGPGGGLLYVKWDDGESMGVSPNDLDLAPKGKTARNLDQKQWHYIERQVENQDDILYIVDNAQRLTERDVEKSLEEYLEDLPSNSPVEPQFLFKSLKVLPATDIEDDGDQGWEVHVQWKRNPRAGRSNLYASTWEELATASRTASDCDAGYGYKKAVQSTCGSAVKRLTKAAEQLARAAFQKDEGVAPFMAEHAKRSKSLTARALVAALKGLGPRMASQVQACACGGGTDSDGDGNCPSCAGAHRLAAKKSPRRYGLYGYPAKTSSLGVGACSALREEAGHIASELHGKKSDNYGEIRGYLQEHGKTGKCVYSKMLDKYYPNHTMRCAADAEIKVTIYSLSSGMPGLGQREGKLVAVSKSGVYYIPKGARKEQMIMTYYSPFIMVVEGWNKPTPGSPWELVSDDGNAQVSKGKYPGSKSQGYADDFLQGAGKNLKPVVMYEKGRLIYNRSDVGDKEDSGRYAAEQNWLVWDDE